MQIVPTYTHMPVLTAKGNDKMWEGRVLPVLTYMSGQQLLHQHELRLQRRQLQQSLPAGPVDYAIDTGQLNMQYTEPGAGSEHPVKHHLPECIAQIGSKADIG